jgi:hypothetical protein
VPRAAGAKDTSGCRSTARSSCAVACRRVTGGGVAGVADGDALRVRRAGRRPRARARVRHGRGAAGRGQPSRWNLGSVDWARSGATRGVPCTHLARDHTTRRGVGASGRAPRAHAHCGRVRVRRHRRGLPRIVLLDAPRPLRGARARRCISCCARPIVLRGDPSSCALRRPAGRSVICVVVVRLPTATGATNGARRRSSGWVRHWRRDIASGGARPSSTRAPWPRRSECG